MKTILVIAATLFLIGCSVTKDNKAFVRVVSNPELAEKTFRELEKRHPAKIDTVTVIKKGEEVVTIDTVYSVDTVTDTITKIKTEIKTVVITKTVSVTDTFKTTKWDDRRLDLCNEDLQKKNGELSESRSQLAELKKENKSKMWWIIGISVVSVLGFGGIFFAKIKKLW